MVIMFADEGTEKYFIHFKIVMINLFYRQRKDHRVTSPFSVRHWLKSTGHFETGENRLKDKNQNIFTN